MGRLARMKDLENKKQQKRVREEGMRPLDAEKEKLFPCRNSKVSNKQHRKDVEKGHIKRKESQKKDRIRWKEMRKNRIFDNQKQNSYFAAIQSIICT